MIVNIVVCINSTTHVKQPRGTNKLVNIEWKSMAILNTSTTMFSFER